MRDDWGCNGRLSATTWGRSLAFAGDRLAPLHPDILPSLCLQSNDLADALRPLPVHIEAPRAWATLADGVAVRGPQALRDALSPRPYPVPSFHTLAHCRCCLTSSRMGRRFRVRPINLFLALLFEQVRWLRSMGRLAGLVSFHVDSQMAICICGSW